MEQERRCEPRYPYIAHATLCDDERSIYLRVRVNGPSLIGCYLDTIHPLPAGTQVLLHVWDDSGSFQARGKIVYSLRNLGVGVALADIDPALCVDIGGSISRCT